MPRTRNSLDSDSSFILSVLILRGLPCSTSSPSIPTPFPRRLEKAERYRLLNRPEQAQSICEDVLRIESRNQDALATLILALTDRFADPRPALPTRPANSCRDSRAATNASTTRPDRRARGHRLAALASKPRSGEAAYVCFRDAMMRYEAAEKLRPPANDDALLRWNSCAQDDPEPRRCRARR